MLRNNPLLERHNAVLPKWNPIYYQDPIEFARGEGRHVWDTDGNKYLDLFGGILTTMTSYNEPSVVEAIRDQAGKMIHSSTLYLIESQIELAEKMAELSGIPDAKVFFLNSGSEANDAALMLATAYRRSNQVLAMRHSYHGRSFATVPITGQSIWSPTSLTPFIVNYIHGSYRYRTPFGGLPDDQYVAACVEDLDNMLKVATSGDVACLIAEPILGVGGFSHGPDGMFKALKDRMDEDGILFISDEVQTGWGRTGDHFWGYEAHGITPDIITFAKGIGNGLPIGGVIARGDIMDCFQSLSISTFGGNPLVMSGALANLNVVLDQSLQQNSQERGQELMAHLEALMSQYDFIGEVRGKGLALALELVKDRETKEPDPERTAALLEASKKHGLLIGKGGFYGNVIRLTPPMSITKAEVAEAKDRLDATFAAI
jgi:4-aminobutyrate aminotransferase